MDTSGSPGLVMLAAHSVGAVVLAAFVATPSVAARTPAETFIAATRTSAPAAMYARSGEVCEALDASGRPTVMLGRLRPGTAVRVLRVATARCDGFTIPMVEVRVADRDSALDGKQGFVVAAAAPMPLAGEAR